MDCIKFFMDIHGPQMTHYNNVSNIFLFDEITKK